MRRLVLVLGFMVGVVWVFTRKRPDSTADAFASACPDFIEVD